MSVIAMCGRYTIKTGRKKIAERLGLEEAELPMFEPRYNLAPTQDGLVVRPGDEPGTRTAAMLRWGLVPFWTKGKSATAPLINARAETVAFKPAFRESFKRRRCLVVADGFYEWSRHGAIKQPYYFTANHGEPFAMAGLWDRWRPSGAAEDETLETFTIITTTANDVLAPHHDRMPVILDASFHDDWLNPFLHEPEALALMLKPYSAMHMLARIVGPRVNSAKFDDPGLLEPPSPISPAADNGGAPTLDDDVSQGQLDLGLG